MVLDDQQIGRETLHLADDGFERREVPVRNHVDMDAVLADSYRELLELLAARSLHLALPGLQVDVAPLQRLGIQGCCNVVKQRELRIEALGDLRGLVDRGQSAR